MKIKLTKRSLSKEQAAIIGFIVAVILSNILSNYFNAPK